jgi:hypothetical protein
MLADLVRREVIDICLAFLDQLDRPLIELAEII